MKSLDDQEMEFDAKVQRVVKAARRLCAALDIVERPAKGRSWKWIAKQLVERDEAQAELRMAVAAFSKRKKS